MEPRATLGKGADCAETPEISEFTVSTVPSGDVLWHIYSDGQALIKVTYGVLPDGFQQVGVAQMLSAGQTVHVSADGRGIEGGADITLQ